MSGLGLTFLRRGGQAHPTAGSDYIKFADDAVFNILMSKGVSSDGVGITKNDAARVTSVERWFTNNTTIETFDELQYFTGLTRLGADMASGATKDGFSGCSNLRSICLPESLLYIGTFAFFKCEKLENIGIPRSIIQIGAGAFRSVAAPLVIDLPYLVALPRFSDLTLSYTFRSSGVSRVENLGQVTTTYGLWQMDAVSRFGVFYECQDLTYADIRHIVNVGDCMFGRCYALKEVIMEDAVNIGQGAFISCKVLEVLRFPPSVTSIGAYAIAYCDALHSIIVEATTPPTIYEMTIDTASLPKLSYIYVPDASVDAYKSAAYWNKFASKIKPLSEYNG